MWAGSTSCRLVNQTLPSRRGTADGETIPKAIPIVARARDTESGAVTTGVVSRPTPSVTCLGDHQLSPRPQGLDVSKLSVTSQPLRSPSLLTIYACSGSYDRHMTDRLGSSAWSVSEARGVVAQLRHVATTGPEYDAVELFLALCDYLDQLHGSLGFDRILPEAERSALVQVVRRVRGRSAVPDEDGERLVQPVNSAVTLAEGRVLAAHLESADGWQRELGLALQGLFSYLDQLYGGPGAFTELLTSEERERVASR